MSLYADLAWLPPAPADFRQRCRALSDRKDGVAAAIALSIHRLDENQLRSLARAFDRLIAAGSDPAPLVPFKLAIVGNATLAPLGPALVASALRHGIALQCVTGAYGQFVREALSPESAINAARPDAVLLALDHRGLPSTGDDVNEAVAFVESLRRGLSANGAICFVQTIAPPPETVFGHFDRYALESPRGRAEAFNAAITASIQGSRDVLFDVAALAETVGLADWHSSKQWNIAKVPFDARYLPLYADHVGRLIGALRGKSRRCLILDLDNTLWGGVVGDDGLAGIVLGQGDPTGEAHLDLQRCALALRERGIVLAVSSKNDDEVARAVFRDHPDMLIRESHIAAFQSNWVDKATNIRAIAEALSLGLDAMVFVDDNPVERGLVRELLPSVAVPEMPEDPALYARTLAAAGYFETVAVSDEDRNRAKYYEANALRATLREDASGDVGAYLASLQMTISFAPFDAISRSRTTQLINKSNQFNLTTRRYDEAEVAALESDPSVFTLQVRLADSFGDNGMISVIVCRAIDEGWEIDTWLMSCRVLGRCVEHAVLSEIVEHARANGVRTLIGRYIPTARNRMVADHYGRLGFEKVSEDASGASLWRFDASSPIMKDLPMAVERRNFPPGLGAVPAS